MWPKTHYEDKINKIILCGFNSFDQLVDAIRKEGTGTGREAYTKGSLTVLGNNLARVLEYFRAHDLILHRTIVYDIGLAHKFAADAEKKHRPALMPMAKEMKETTDELSEFRDLWTEMTTALGNADNALRSAKSGAFENSQIIEAIIAGLTNFYGKFDHIRKILPKYREKIEKHLQQHRETKKEFVKAERALKKFHRELEKM